MKIRFLLALMVALAGGHVYAEPSTKIAWTPETLAFVKSGDPTRGQTLASGCAACHGAEGQGMAPNLPSLAGQVRTYTFRQLMDFKEASRRDPVMGSIVAGLSDQDMADIAAWYAELPATESNSDSAAGTKAQTLVEFGDSKRLVPACKVCHGSGGEGEKMDTPALSGQLSGYLEKTLLDYKLGSRRNDVYARMRFIAEQLTVEEIEELANLYSGMSR